MTGQKQTFREAIVKRRQYKSNMAEAISTILLLSLGCEPYCIDLHMASDNVSDFIKGFLSMQDISVVVVGWLNIRLSAVSCGTFLSRYFIAFGLNHIFSIIMWCVIMV